MKPNGDHIQYRPTIISIDFVIKKLPIFKHKVLLTFFIIILYYKITIMNY